MNPDGSPIPYQTLVALADDMLEKCEDDAKCLCKKLDALDPSLRNELLVSYSPECLSGILLFFPYIP